MPKLNIDGIELEVQANTTVLQACETLGIEIPRFCYHERLSIAGNCRMCLVEMEKSPKPIASCAMPVADGMVIKTQSDLVKKARKGVMEFLLINHPLDCPICDQGGECDLQDQAMAYGFDRSRYHENKRAVRDKDFGPLIKTSMTRCIHCTRCVRFATEIAGAEELGAVGRGEHLEINTYLEKAIASELSGNLIDLCPVGALTSKPYAFVARPWELKKTETIDVLDAVGSNIRVDTRGRQVLRILPKINEDINEEWISDKTRFACDGLLQQRLDRPYVRRHGKLEETSWTDALKIVASKMRNSKPHRIAAIAGDLVDVESMFVLKDLMTRLESPHYDCRQYGEAINHLDRASYLFNTTIAGIEEADLCLLIGVNPRWEAALINARLRKRFLQGNFTIGSLGPKTDLTYPIHDLGNNPRTLIDIALGNHDFTRVLDQAKKPMVIVGSHVLTRPDVIEIKDVIYTIVQKFNFIQNDWNGFNLLHRAAGRVGGLDIGFVPPSDGKNVPEILAATAKGDMDVIYLLGADEIDTKLLGNSFVIYQGHHGDKGAHRADVILPGAAYTEKKATYVNLEGRIQHTSMAAFPPGDAKEDWKILRALAEQLNFNLPYIDYMELYERLTIKYPNFSTSHELVRAEWYNKERSITEKIAISDKPFVLPINNFYMTDPITRASPTMAKCSQTFNQLPIEEKI
ncbi:MAG: NADH-quinone oxidoreductase subunit NuoG [Alphaproteobacteria bacterium]|nr:NADH-quinone oxidoreductase subunit NuoG [Alphaproteobacteria bacterium]